MTIDLSKLEPPLVVPEPTVDELTAEWIAALQAEDPATFASVTPGTPLYAAARTFAAMELRHRKRANEAARSQYLSSAAGTSLDGLGALYDVPRLLETLASFGSPAVYESDADYRGALHRAPRTFGTGSKERYERAALNADSRIGSVWAATPNPTELVIEWLPRPGVDPADHPAIETAIADALQDTDRDGFEIELLTDSVTITEALLVNVVVSVTLHLERGVDADTAEAAALENLLQWGETVRQVRAPIAFSAIYAAADVEGVVKVDINQPVTEQPSTAAVAYSIGAPIVSSQVAAWL